MPTRTITIDLDAYACLKKAKKPTESFSQTIKRVVPEPIDLNAWFQGLADDPISPEAAAAVERREWADRATFEDIRIAAGTLRKPSKRRSSKPSPRKRA